MQIGWVSSPYKCGEDFNFSYFCHFAPVSMRTCWYMFVVLARMLMLPVFFPLFLWHSEVYVQVAYLYNLYRCNLLSWHVIYFFLHYLFLYPTKSIDITLPLLSYEYQTSIKILEVHRASLLLAGWTTVFVGHTAACHWWRRGNSRSSLGLPKWSPCYPWGWETWIDAIIAVCMHSQELVEELAKGRAHPL